MVLATVLIAVSCSTPSPTITPAPADPNGEWQPTTAWEKTLAHIQPDGSVDLDTALVAFSLAIAPLPGVTLPPEDAGLIGDGTEAVRWLRSHWDELTDAQQTEAQRHLVPAGQPGAVAEAVPGRSERLMGGLATVALGQPIAIDAIAVPSPPGGQDVEAAASEGRPVQAVIDAAEGVIAAHLKRPLLIRPKPVINRTEVQIRGVGALAYAVVVDKDGTGVGAAKDCYIWVNPSGLALDDVAFTATLAHEVYHCFQGVLRQSLREFEIPSVTNAWVTEGQAEWVGEAVAKELSGQVSQVGVHWWVPYLLAPKTPLLQRTYDAIGFYGRLEERGQDPWLILDSMITASNGVEAFQRATETIGELFTDSWASGYFRDTAEGPDWSIDKGTALPARVEPRPLGISLANGDSYRIDVKPYANAIFVLDGPAEVVRFQITGRARLIDRIGYQVLGLDGRDFCLKDSCTCPPKMHFKVDPPGFLTPQLKFAVSGSTEGAIGAVVGVSLDELCERDGAESRRPCATGCAMSNGDPHLRMVDGHSYDFMAAGEFTLLRSGNGAIEVQVRQEPYRVSKTVSINTALALSVNGRRVGIAATTTGIELRIDGTPVAPTSPVDLGGGATVTLEPKGVKVVLPDGSQVWALSLGDYGINVLVAPSSALRDAGSGLFGRTLPGGAGLPVLPDGTSLPRADDHHARYVQLYQTFADAWRVTDASSLFEYAPGTSTTTFTRAGFPSEADLIRQQALPIEAVAGAREACAQIADPDLLNQCVFDVAVTNNLAFAKQYALSQRFVTQGSGALGSGGDAPSAAPSASPALPPSVVELLPSLRALDGQALGPDGTLYLSVEYADDTFEVLAVDAPAGTISRRVKAAGGGQIAYAAGSVWVGEFTGTYSSKGCSVTRLDPLSLAVRTTVPTVCTRFGTALAGTRDSVWFHDPTGVDADGKGGHLRRIDPQTNAPTTDVALPFAYGYLTSSASHVFYGDDGRGHFRVADAGSTLERLGAPDNAEQFPAGDGIWMQQDQVALRYAAVSGPSDRITIDGVLVAADTRAVYVEDGGWERLSRYPVDGGRPMVIATSPPSAPGGRIYSFGGNELLVGDTGLVTLWLFPSPTARSGPFVLLMRWIPLP